jgi:surfactin synthase thioesterase subunit
MISLRRAERGQPTFVFFLHAGGSPLSTGRLVASLPSSVGVIVANLPRAEDRVELPRRVADAVAGMTEGFLALDGVDEFAPVLVGNSYGALIAYEMAWSLGEAGVAVERLIVSGLRSPSLASADAPLHRLPSDRLWSELEARFGAMPGEGAAGNADIEESLRADLEACDTYRHTHVGRLAIPIDVLHLQDDPSVSAGDLMAWQAVTNGPVRKVPHVGGHFAWATHADAVAATLIQLAGGGNEGDGDGVRGDCARQAHL